ncbi:MAG TPA: MFS transporter [Pirellulaceae bacterium]|nr:MFS transporter [Pirellulaceae bacterium]
MSEVSEAAAEKQTRSSLTLMTRLSVMMFLQYFIQGSYLPIASVYVQDTLGFSGRQVGWFGSALAVGPILTPFLLGQLVDRRFATQRVIAVCHLCGGVLMLALCTQSTFWPVIVLGTAYSVVYIPTMMLTNSLAFQHLRNSDVEFPWARLFGTIGFVVPAFLIEAWWLKGMEGEQLDQARVICFILAGLMGLVMGAYSLFLPHTPPAGKDKDDYAPGIIIRMMRYRHFLVLVLISFLIAIVHKFFFVWNSPFLREILDSGGWGGAAEMRISSIGQLFEVLVMVVLGFSIAKFGFKATLITGAVAYSLRCILFAMVFSFELPFAGRLALAFTGQALHGLCFGCFLAAAYIYVDRVAPKDVRGSMQTMYGTFVIALGFFAGGFIAGEVGDVFSTETGIRNWTMIWLSSAALAAVCVAGLMLFFPASVPDPDDVSTSEA